MKRVSLLFVFLLTFISVYSFSLTLTDIKIKLVATIAHVLTKESVVRVDLEDKSFLNTKKKEEDHIIFVNSCEKADIIITDNVNKISKKCRNKLIFVTNYHTYEKAPYAVGALFWQKGRPVLIFNKKAIEKKRIRLPKQFSQYID